MSPAGIRVTSHTLAVGDVTAPDVTDDDLDALLALPDEVSYHDPYVPRLMLDEQLFESVELSPDTLAGTDAVVITTDHTDVDYDLVLERAEIIVDPRNALGGRRGRATVYPIAGPPREGLAAGAAEATTV